MALFSGKEASDMWESWLGFQSLDHFSLLSKWRSTFFPGNSPGQTEPRRPVAAPRCGRGRGPGRSQQPPARLRPRRFGCGSRARGLLVALP